MSITEEHKAAALAYIRDNGGADASGCIYPGMWKVIMDDIILDVWIDHAGEASFMEALPLAGKFKGLSA